MESCARVVATFATHNLVIPPDSLTLYKPGPGGVKLVGDEFLGAVSTSAPDFLRPLDKTGTYYEPGPQLDEEYYTG